jgi:hypothetical protein
MKKLTVLLMGVFFVLGLASLAMAQQKAAPAQKPATPKHHVFIGTVDTVTLADPVKGTKSEIVVMNKANKSMTFLVMSTTTLYDPKGSAITLDKIVKGNEVDVKYTTTHEGVHQAGSVKVLK